MRRTAPPLLATDFGEFELTNAISWRVSRRQLRAIEAQAVLDLFLHDVENGIIRIVPVPSAAFTRAKQIARTQTPILGNRALDVLHVAIALSLQADTFLTFDRKQAKLAAAEGLHLQ